MRLFAFLAGIVWLVAGCSGPATSPEDAAGHYGVLDLAGDITPVHDPAVAKEGDTFYIFSTGRGVGVRCSIDLLLWEECGRVFFSYPQWVLERVPGVEDLWAPDVARSGDRWLLYYSASRFGSQNSAIGLATNVTLDRESPDFEWVDQGEVISTTETDAHNAIDPNFVIDADGQPWLAFGSFWSGVKLVKLDAITYKPAAGASLISLAFKPGSNAVEAAFVVRRGDWYYLFVSHDLCCQGVESTYNVRVGRSATIEGPYVDREDVTMLEGGGTQVLSGSTRWRGPGHNSILVEGDRYFIVYHSYDALTSGSPTLRIEVLEWDADGWPSTSVEISES